MDSSPARTCCCVGDGSVDRFTVRSSRSRRSGAEESGTSVQQYEKLELAMEDSHSTNIQTLQALRTLFDDVVA